MLSLKLQTAMKPIHVKRTCHILTCPQLMTNPFLGRATVESFHHKVRDADLNMEDASNCVREHNIWNTLIVRQAHDKLIEPHPENSKSKHLRVTVVNTFTRKKGEPALKNQIEACNHHHRIVQNVLVTYKEASKDICLKVSIMECTVEAFEELICNGQKRQVLDVWVILDTVCHTVVSVVGQLPPAKPHSTKHITDKTCPKEIHIANMRYSVVASIMTNKSYLLPKHSHSNSG
mmetsp:Transcript_17217/g.33764  ORF Transcript_17217/g.33764 Transcript_17217/m.33764 type:complete len:233 (-) Transcript_17217:1667-2365(-)